MDHRIVVFTVHKAASLGVYDVMRRVAMLEKWPLYSANLQNANLIEPVRARDREFYQQLEGKKGLVGPVRMPVALDAETIKNDRFILHLRDPRDVLVSMFYSFSFSHPGVDESLREERRQMGVNKFALENSAQLKRKYELYIRDVLPLPRTTFLKYETFVRNRPEWMRAFLTALELNPKSWRYRLMGWRNPAAKVREENIHAHIRKAAPGDYLEKLTDETRAALNTDWEPILTKLDYSL
ncbi:hypothetical protein [Hyphococcus sp.]|uniref:hypothetical protein n=1 Tax=Hyphococcus sp. TaxID=2038636 RepID=UPI003CCBF2D9